MAAGKKAFIPFPKPSQIKKASAPNRKAPSLRTKVDGLPHNKKKKNTSVEESTEMLSELYSKREGGSPMLLEPNRKIKGPYRCTSTGVRVSDEGTQTEYLNIYIYINTCCLPKSKQCY